MIILVNEYDKDERLRIDREWPETSDVDDNDNDKVSQI